jgi:putative membrane protein
MTVAPSRATPVVPVPPSLLERRRLILFAGFALLAFGWLGPLPALSAHSFAAHMGLHMLVIVGAAPLIAIGLARTRLALALAAAGVLAPILASVAEFVVVWGWHAPALHAAAKSAPLIFGLEQIMFLSVGVLLWLTVFGGPMDDRRHMSAAVFALFLTSMHMTLLGAVLCFATRPLYAHDHGHMHGALSPLDDQLLGGMLMLGLGGVAYLLAGLWLMAKLLKDPPDPQP